MARGYDTAKLKRMLVKLLAERQTGMSIVEIARSMRMSRLTVSKYLKVFEARGEISSRRAGGTRLWFIEGDADSYAFPEDYHVVSAKYLEYLLESGSARAARLLRSCIEFSATGSRLVLEAVLPAIREMQKMYKDGRLGRAELRYLEESVLESLRMMEYASLDPGKNAIILSAGGSDCVIAESAAAALRHESWRVTYLGDISGSADAMFDIEIQKVLYRVWKRRQGIMIVIAFSSGDDAARFFSESLTPLRKDYGSGFRLVLHGTIPDDQKADLVSDDIATIIQWSQTAYEGAITDASSV